MGTRMKYEKGYWLNKDSRTYLGRGYLREGQTAEDRIIEIATAAEGFLGVKGFAEEFTDYMMRGWISLSSPVWANFGAGRGLPIACNGSFIDDNMDSILGKTAEIGKMTQLGAGTSAYFGALRARGSAISSGGTADGPVHYMDLVSATTNVVSQSNVRRGHCAVYLPVEHPDVKEFLDIREEGHSIQNLSLGVCISDNWMEEMIAGDKAKRKLWARIIQKRFESGYPYVFFTDNVNRGAPEVYKDKGMKIHASNMCVEIALPSSADESFVCCLASLNLLHYDDWKDTGVARALTMFLDAVMSEYIAKTEGVPFMQDARRFAERHRAIGVGVLGWHSYLQSKMIPFKGAEAKKLNIEIHRNIFAKCIAASQELASLLGEPDLLKGYGRRNTTVMAIAPTTSSSFILGQVSPSIEPLNSNYFTKDLQKGKFGYKNLFLKELLASKGIDTKETWESILINGGSVQHIDELTADEKAVFETFGEIPQIEIIQQAADRQKEFDQGQSLNLMIHPNAPLPDVNKLMIEAWKLGVKTLYYQRSTNPSQELARELLSCKSCEA